MPSDLQCKPGSSVVGRSLAAVDCQTGVSGISDLTYWLFPDQVSLRNYNTSDLQLLEGLQACPGRGQSPQNWQSAANPQQLEGTLVCYANEHRQAIRWSIDPQMVLGYVRGKDPGTTIDQVYQWWAARYQ